MKPEDYLRKLSEIAEWEVPKIDEVDKARRTPPHLKKRTRYKTEEEYLESLNSLNPDFVQNGRNLTMMPRIKRIKFELKACSLNCGQQVIDQKIEKSFHNWPQAHWRTKCTNCQYYLHPEGHLVKGTHEITAYFKRKIADKNK